jgi:hypothetical protein
MKQHVGVLTGFGRGGRIVTWLATFLLVVSLIGGIGAFIPVLELNDLDDTLSVELVLAEELAIEDPEIVARVGGRFVVEISAPEQFTGFSHRGSVLAAGQVVSMLRNSGIQRAVHPTGPPPVVA